MTPTVHVLHYGVPLCGSVHGLPGNWGPGHQWVREGADATCSACKDAALLLAVIALESERRHAQMLPPAGPDDGESE